MNIRKYSLLALLMSPLLFATTFPVAKTDSYTVTPAFDTFSRGNGSSSQNHSTRLVVKNDIPSYTRQSFIGFDLKKYAIKGMIESVTLRLYLNHTELNLLEQRVYMLADDSFWNTTFKFKQKPRVRTMLKAYTLRHSDEKHWVEIDLPQKAVDKIYKDGKLSLSLVGGSYGQKAWASFGSSEDAKHQPQLRINLNHKNIDAQAANSVRYITFVASKEENSFPEILIGDLDLVDQDAHIIDKSEWTEVKSSGGTVQNLLDSNASTLWVGKGATPHYVTLDLKKEHNIAAVIYTPRAKGYYGRVADFMVYGSNHMQNWSLIASRHILHGQGNIPKIAYSGKLYTNGLQRKDAFDFMIHASQYSEKKRLSNNALRSGLQTTGLYAQKEGLLILSVSGDVENNHIELRTGHWAGSKRYRLKKGFNSIKVYPNDYLYIIASKNAQQTHGEKVHITFDTSGVKTYPLFKLGKTTAAQWEKSLEERTSDTVQIESKKVLLTFDASQLDTLDPIDFELLARSYDEVATIAERAAGINPRSRNPLHYPDANKYHYVPLDKGYMMTFFGRISYRPTLSYRMLTIDNMRNFWGIWHEMGHNLETIGIEWRGQKEVAVNIYAFAARAYTMPLNELVTLYDKHFTRAFSKLDDTNTYMNLDQTSREMMYHHLFFLFGEKFHYQLHQRYRENIDSKRDVEFFVGTTDEQMNVYAIMASKVTQTNLVPFFDFWKFPLTQETRNTINSYGYNTPTNFKQLPSELINSKTELDYDMIF